MKKSETKKYIAVIDPKASVSSVFLYKALNAKNLIEAMNEASKYMTDDIYLINIFEKQSGGDKEKVFYSKVLTNRGNGWYTNNEFHASEREETIAFYYKWHDASKPVTSCDFDWIA